MARKLWLVAVMALGAIGLVHAEDAKTESKEETVVTKLSETKKQSTNAAIVNFRKDLGVPLSYLDTIGSRIQEARKSADPVSLAMLAEGLKVAEKLAKKSASVKAADLTTESIELAKLRGVSMELAAILEITSDTAIQKELKKELAASMIREKDAKLKLASGEAAKRVIGTLEVINNTDECLRIFVDGKFVGEVHMGESQQFHVHSHAHVTQFSAYCEEDGELVKTGRYHGSTNFVRWEITR